MWVKKCANSVSTMTGYRPWPGIPELLALEVETLRSFSTIFAQITTSSDTQVMNKKSAVSNGQTTSPNWPLAVTIIKSYYGT